MAVYNKFEPFVEHIAEGVHNLATGAITVALTNAANAPLATYATRSQLTEISYTNLSARVVTISASAQTAGVYKATATDLVLTASGTVAGFRYIVVYNDTPTSPADPLICYFDYGSDLVLLNTETLTLDFDGTNGLLQIT
jgi:hypothetical protein